MPTYKALFFDLFHTLVDVASSPGIGGRYTADILGVSREAWHRACFSDRHDICSATRHRDVVATLARHLDPSISNARIDEATRERQQRFDHTLRHVEPEILDVLRRLSEAGHRLVLVSNASSGEVNGWSDSPLAGYFDHAIFSCECGVKKPQPAIYHQALDAVGVDAAEALFIGDGGSDEHRGAAGCGIDGVLVTHYLRHLSPSQLARREAAARWRIGHLRELFEIDGVGGEPGGEG